MSPCATRLALIALVVLWWTAPARADPVILDPGVHALRAGAASPFAIFEQTLWQQLDACGTPPPPRPGPWGRLGPHTAAAIRAALACPGFGPVDAASAARRGALTEAVWRAVMGATPVPGLRERVDVIVLSFEDTDFGEAPEWNFCRDSADADAARPPHLPKAMPCYNLTDPCSMLTWGPRGATAGQGQEIQAVLRRVLAADPGLVRRAFDAELPNALRFLVLRGPPVESCDGDSPLEHFMCAVWVDPARRAAWERAFAMLGAAPAVRAAYRAVYDAEQFDGYKLRAYWALWNRLGLRPSEVDYAFFYDRATHIGEPPDDLAPARLQACVDGESAARTRNAAARRCLARLHPHPLIPFDRRARDVAFYRTGYPPGALTPEERHAWQHHIPLDAEADIALSDARQVALGDVVAAGAAAGEAPAPAVSGVLTARERACPAAIRKPIRTRPPH